MGARGCSWNCPLSPRKHDPKSLFLERRLPRRSDFGRRIRRGNELASNHSLWVAPASQDRLTLSRHEKLAVDDLPAAGGCPERVQGRVVRHFAVAEEHGSYQRGRRESTHYSNLPRGMEVLRPYASPCRTSATANSAQDVREGVPSRGSYRNAPSGRAGGVLARSSSAATGRLE